MESLSGLWIGVYQDLYEIVTTAWAKYGASARKPAEGVKPTVSMSNPLETGFDQMRNMISDFWGKDIMPAKTLSRIALQMPELGLSTSDIESILLEMYPEEVSVMSAAEYAGVLSAVMNTPLPETMMKEIWSKMEELANEPG